MENNTKMNRDGKACNGTILNKLNKPTGKCLVKQNCTRYLLHLQNNERQSYQPVPYKAVVDKVCIFKIEL
jgi:hypothetical protein